MYMPFINDCFSLFLNLWAPQWGNETHKLDFINSEIMKQLGHTLKKIKKTDDVLLTRPLVQI